MRARDGRARTRSGREADGRREARHGRSGRGRSLAAKVEREPRLAARLRELRSSEPRGHVVAGRGVEQIRVSERVVVSGRDVVERRLVGRRVRRHRVEERVDEADPVRRGGIALACGRSVDVRQHPRPQRSRRRGAADREPTAELVGEDRDPTRELVGVGADVRQLATTLRERRMARAVGRTERIAGLAQITRLEGVRSSHCTRVAHARHRRIVLPGRHRPRLGDAAAGRSPGGSVVPDVLGGRLGGVVDRRASGSHDVRLARRVVDGQDRGDRRRRPERVAVVAALVPGGREDRLPLGRGLLEDDVLGLLYPRRALFEALLAEPPARGHDLVDVVVDDPGVLVERAEGGVRGLVDVDARARSERRDVLDVEDRLARARPAARASVHVDRVEAAEHRRSAGRAEVARVEGLEIARRERLQLVDGDVLARAGVAGAVEAEDAVRVGDLVVGQAAEVLGGRGRVGARRR